MSAFPYRVQPAAIALLGSLFAVMSVAAYGADPVVPAAQSTAAPEFFSTGYLFQVLGSLLVVFLCLFALVFLLRRVNRVGGASASALRVLASASVGQREKVILLQAGEEQLLLGVAPGNVRMLHTLAENVELGEQGGSTERFSDVLRAVNPLGSQT